MKIAILAVCSTLALLCACTREVNQGLWKNITFMDCDNTTHSVSIRLTRSMYDRESGYLRVDGEVKNRMKEYRLFNVRNWVYRLNREEGKYLKPQSVGLPSIPLQGVDAGGTAHTEKFTLIYKIGTMIPVTTVIMDYADQFFMTGQINQIILSVPLAIEYGVVTSRG